MEILVKTTQLILSLSILVILHEFGHFFFAKLFKTRVEKFYLFFNPWFSLFKVKKGETEYGIGWLPLGGYVKISGMIDESMDKEQMKQPPQPWEFRSKKTWQRLLIMLGGVLVNFILAFIIYIMILFTWGEKYLPNDSLSYGIMADSTAIDLGFKNGDKILTVGSEKIIKFKDAIHNIIVNDNKTVVVNRNGENVEIKIPATAVEKLINDPTFISPRFPFEIGDIPNESKAKKMGFEVGDKIIEINGQPVEFYDQVKEILNKNKNKEVDIKIKRKDQVKEIKAQLSKEGTLGVYVNTNFEDFFKFETHEYSFFEAIPAGIKKAFRTLNSYIKQLKMLFNTDTGAYKSLGGFISIGKIFPSTWDWQAFWSLTAFLSIILAIMNVLPIPALDGGHVMFLLYEMITGRKPGEKFMEYAQIAGMVILIGLLLFANGNDIIKLFK